MVGEGGQQEVYAAVLQGIQQLTGRKPLLPMNLVEALTQAEWPGEALLHPSDFWLLTAPGALPWMHPFQVHKDAVGPYFYMSRTRVRPIPAPTGASVDLSEWAPKEEPSVEIATFTSSAAERATRIGRGRA